MIHVETEDEDYILLPCTDKATKKMRLVNISKNTIGARQYDSLEAALAVLDKLKQAGRITRYTVA